MSLFSSAEVADLRRLEGASLFDACEIRRPASRGDFDAGTGTYPAIPGALVYSGPCRVKKADRLTRDVVARETQVTVRSYEILVDGDAAEVTKDDVLTVTASSDPELVGRPLRVDDVRYGSLHTGRRIVAEDDLG